MDHVWPSLDSSSLWSAASRGDLAAVQNLLNKGNPVDAEAPNGSTNPGVTALQLAAENGHAAIVQQLLAAGAEVDKATVTTPPALHLAASRGHVAMVKQLLDAGAALDGTGKGSTPLLWAASGGQAAVVQQLLDAGAAVNLADDTSWTALHNAASSGYLEVVQILLTAGADACIANSMGRTPLNLAAANGQLAAVKALIQHAAMPMPLLVSAASSAVASQRLEVLSVLVHHIATVDRETAVNFVKAIPEGQGLVAIFKQGWLTGMAVCNATAEQEKAAIAQKRKELQELKHDVQQLFIATAAQQRRDAAAEDATTAAAGEEVAEAAVAHATTAEGKEAEAA